MNTLTNIIELIKFNKKPYIYLSTKAGTRYINAGSFECEICNENDSIDDKLDRAINWLDNYVKLFPKNTIFNITIRNSSTANGKGIVELGEFVISSDVQNDIKEQNQHQQTHEQITALGYVSRDAMQVELMKKDIELERFKNKQEFEKMLAEAQANIDTIANQAKLNLLNPDNLKGLIREATPILAMITGNQNVALAGVNEEVEQQEEFSLKKILINEIVNKSEGLTENEISVVNKFIDKIKIKKNERTIEKTDNN